MDQRKVLAVVVGMAFRTGLFVGKCGVKPAALGQLFGDFGVAFLALQYGRTPTCLVAARALRRTIE